MSLFTYHCGCVTEFYYLCLAVAIIVLGLFCYIIGRTIGYSDGWVESWVLHRELVNIRRKSK